MPVSNDGINYFIGSLFYNKSTLADAKADLNNFLQLALGSGNFAISSGTDRYLFEWRPDTEDASLTGTIAQPTSKMANATSPNNSARFSHPYAPTFSAADNYFAGINTSFGDDATTSIFSANSTLLNLPDYSTTLYCWLTGNSQSIGSFLWDRRTGYSLFVWTGAVVDPRPDSPSTYPENCCCIVSGYDGKGNSLTSAIRVGLAGTTEVKPIATSGIANYRRTCVGDPPRVEYPPISAYISLDETSGDRLDSTDNGLDLEDTQGKVGSSVGIIGRAADFSNIRMNDLSLTAKYPLSPKWQFFERDFTVAFWFFQFDRKVANYFMARKKDSTKIVFYFYASIANRHIRVGVRNSTSGIEETLTIPFVYDDNVAYHMAFTHDFNTKTVEAFANGASLGTKTYSIDLEYSGQDTIHFGTNGTPAQGLYLTGWMDQFILFDEILSSEQIALLYNNGNGVDYETLAGIDTTEYATTDLYLLDNDLEAGNPTAGRCSNLLLAKGQGFQVGKFYNLTEPHVDGGSPNFICVGDWGADKILMRTTSDLS